MAKVKEHVWHICGKEGCMVCEGGLSECTVCGQVEGTLEDVCPGPKVKKVKVRIAVGVDSRGSWDACGYGTIKVPNDLSQQINDDMMMSAAVEDLNEGENRYWVTAELEVPEPGENVEEIEGDVVDDE